MPTYSICQTPSLLTNSMASPAPPHIPFPLPPLPNGPTDGLMTEDATAFLIAEDGSTFLVQE